MNPNTQKDEFDLEFEEVTTKAPEGDKPGGSESKELPEKLKGKSPEELADMYQNLERMNSRQAQELGKYRNQVDTLLGLREPKDNVTKPKPVERKPIEASELLSDPNKALDQVIQSSEVAQKADTAVQRITELETTLAQQEFVRKHPKYQEDMQDPEFLKWVQSNELRSNLAQQADKNLNFKAATALWDLWSEHKDLVVNAERSRQQSERKEALKKVTTVPGGSADQRTDKKPIFSRAKLLDLQIRSMNGDPAARAKWEDPAFQQARRQAYQEGRIK